MAVFMLKGVDFKVFLNVFEDISELGIITIINNYKD
jgi:hypothetical protein